MSQPKDEEISDLWGSLGCLGVILLAAFVSGAARNGWFGARWKQEPAQRRTIPRNVLNIPSVFLKNEPILQTYPISLSGKIQTAKGQGLQTTNLEISLDAGAKVVILLTQPQGVLNRSVSLQTDSEGNFQAFGRMQAIHFLPRQSLSRDSFLKTTQPITLPFVIKCQYPKFQHTIQAPLSYRNDSAFIDLEIETTY